MSERCCMLINGEECSKAAVYRFAIKYDEIPHLMKNHDPTYHYRCEKHKNDGRATNKNVIEKIEKEEIQSPIKLEIVEVDK